MDSFWLLLFAINLYSRTTTFKIFIWIDLGFELDWVLKFKKDGHF